VDHINIHYSFFRHSFISDKYYNYVGAIHMPEKKKIISYKAFIATGVSFVGLGVVFMLAINTIVGLAILATGFGNLAIGLSSGKKEN
jgi:uncharacterized membrane protein YhiD involved in acid resistance